MPLVERSPFAEEVQRERLVAVADNVYCRAHVFHHAHGKHRPKELLLDETASQLLPVSLQATLALP